jgi:hypothetical protein
MARDHRVALLVGQVGDRLERRHLGQQLQRLHVVVVEHDRLHRQRPARAILHLPAAQRLEERVARDPEQPRPRRLGPRLVVRRRPQSGRERLSREVERGLDVEDPAAEVAVDRVHVTAIERRERLRRLAGEHQQLLVAAPLEIHPSRCMTDRPRA